MDKRHVHHLWRQLKRVSYWYFLLAFVGFGVVFVFAYRNNNLTALRLRDQLLADDKAGTHVGQSLDKLRTYIYGHMNASLDGGPGSIYPPIQLQGTYSRLVEVEKQRIQAANNQVAADARHACGPPNYLICIQNYEAAHNVSPQTIPDSLYKFDFAAPRWSPDLAGWSLVATLLCLVLFVVRFCLELWLKHTLRQHA